MADELRMAVFDIDGKADEPHTAGVNGQSMDNEPSKVLNLLREKAESVAEKIEREVRKQMPPYVSVQASVQFDKGSIILTGTVALLSWSGSIVFNAAREEVERQVASLIKASVQRALTPVLASVGFSQAAGPMEMTVRPSGRSVGSLFTRSPEPQASEGQSAPRPTALFSPRLATPTGLRGLTIAVIFVFALQVLLVIDRFFEIHAKPPTTNAEPSSAATVSEHPTNLNEKTAVKKN